MIILPEHLTKNNKQRNKKEEENEQGEFVSWARSTYPFLLITCSLGGIPCSIRQGVRYKRMGYKKSWPDLTIAYPNRGFHGCFIEMKKTNGSKDSDQEKLILVLNSLGYYAKTCIGIEDAKATLTWYMKGN
ncbi:hypothetical protein EKK58_09940 [Candidatus Dependentiae bacterium]|nr:MAG: hypothetical protein EKK58_09940 [Candidatus Dependentiae bacterium]